MSDRTGTVIIIAVSAAGDWASTKEGMSVWELAPYTLE
jgi:hypothetical protein